MEVPCDPFAVIFAVREEGRFGCSGMTVQKEGCRIATISGGAQDLIAFDPIEPVPWRGCGTHWSLIVVG